MVESRYRPEIDGLRAVAVAAVVLYHMELGLPGGFVGVDVFFVISGFLITGIIRRGLTNESFSLAEFWERRIRRIFPALFVMVVATLAVGFRLLIPTELVDLGKSSVAQALLLANAFYWKTSGYFQDPAEFKPLLHTWSLAVEEQFYLFFPLALCFLKRLSSKRLFALLAIVALISFTASVYGARYHHNFTFYLLPTRAWELLIGCMLAVLPWKCESSSLRDSAIATLGFLAIVFPIFLYDHKTPFPGLAAAPPVLGTAAIIFATANTPQVWLCRLLSLRPVVFIGLISYSLYLWHWPVVVYTKMHLGHLHWKSILFASAVSLALAALSWKFVETPLRRNTYLKQRRYLFFTTLALSGTTVAVGILFVSTKGASWRFPNYSPILAADMTGYGGSIASKPDSKKLDFLVFGDSHGMHLAQTINSLTREYSLSGDGVLQSGSIPLPNASRVIGRERKANIFSVINHKRPRHVVLVARWKYYISTTSESGREIIKKDLIHLAEFCSQREITLWVVKQTPNTAEAYPAREWLMYSLGLRNAPSNKKRSLSDHQREAGVESLFQPSPSGSVRFIDLAPLLFDDEQMSINYRGGRSLYRDSSHLTAWGSEHVRPALKAMFREMAIQAPPASRFYAKP